MAALTAAAALAASTVLPATAAGVAGLGAVAFGASQFEKKLKQAGNVKTPGVTQTDAAPKAVAETGDPLDSLRFRKKRRGRADTIQAGSLIPESVGKKTLLG